MTAVLRPFQNGRSYVIFQVKFLKYELIFMADTKPDGFESFVRFQMFEIDKAPEINIWNDQLRWPSGRSHDAKWSPSVKSSNRDGIRYIRAYNNERVKKSEQRIAKKGDKRFEKKKETTGSPRRESAQGVWVSQNRIKMTFKILRDKSKPFINFETIIEDLVQVSSAFLIGQPIRTTKNPFLVSNCFRGEKS